MAREIDTSKPLSDEDLVYLRSRYSREYVDNLIAIAGTADGADGVEDDEEARLRAEREAEAAAAAEAARRAEEAEEEARRVEEENARQQQEAEDLIGGGEDFDVLGATESEVKAWAATASDEDKAAALATEQGREDREARKGVVAILS